MQNNNNNEQLKYILELYRYYYNPKQYKLKGVSPNFLYTEEESKHRCKINLTNDRYIESELYETNQLAQYDCARKAVNYIRKMDFKSLNQIRIKRQMQNHINQATILLILLFPLVYCCSNNYWTNIYSILYYLNHGDIFLILGPSKPLENKNGQFFFAQLTDDVVLRAVGDNDKYPTYILPKLINIGVSKNKGRYFIDLLTFERDGKPKRYEKRDVLQSKFKIADEPIKLCVISQNGKHFIVERYSEALPLNTWNWYTSVLSLYKSYLFNKLDALFTNNYKEHDNVCGFNNFQNPHTYKLKNKIRN